MNKGVYLIWDLPTAEAINPHTFFEALGQDQPCAVQLRAKSSRVIPSQINALLKACQSQGVPLFVNDVQDWVIQGVYGLHLGQNDGLAPDLNGVLVGRSTHDLDQVQRAAADDRIACLGFGPIRSTTSKVGALSPRGFEALHRAVEHAQGKPVIAIGGLGLTDVRAVHSSGAHAAAVISAVWSQPDPVQALRSLVQHWACL